uniref:Uncharacterized protein n=1 Tax=Rhizophora mucronata TaxID=61149 RepID=A0A2P2NAT1_RHIMU
MLFSKRRSFIQANHHGVVLPFMSTKMLNLNVVYLA